MVPIDVFALGILLPEPVLLRFFMPRAPKRYKKKKKKKSLLQVNRNFFNVQIKAKAHDTEHTTGSPPKRRNSLVL
jgi:hypothetical protein